MIIEARYRLDDQHEENELLEKLLEQDEKEHQEGPKRASEQRE